MELTSNKTLVAIVRERRLMPRFHLLTRVDISVVGGGDIYWGSMRNLSRTGVAVVLRHQLKSNQKVTIRFHLQNSEGREVVENLAAKAIWQCGDNAGLEFTSPLTAGSPALQEAPCLVAHLVMKEAER